MINPLPFAVGLVASAFLLSPSPSTAVQDGDRDEFGDAMLGVYTIERGQRGDERLSGDELEGTVRITRDRISLHRADGGELYAARYHVDEVFNETARLSLETLKVQDGEADELDTESENSAGEKGRALVTLNTGNDLLTIIYDVRGEDYPDDFKPDNDDQHLFILKKKDDIEK